MKETEFERKRLLSREEYEGLKAKLGGFPTEVLQINYYYDTQNMLLHKSGITLRLRRMPYDLRLELKRHRRFDGNVRVCDEFPAKLDAMPERISVALDCGTVADCRCLGSLVTRRLNYIGDGYVLSLDDSFYLGCEDFEIEVETLLGAPEPDFVKALGLTFPDNTPGKYTRFLREYQKLAERHLSIALSDDGIDVSNQ